MKLFNKILFFVLVLFTFTISVNAADFSTSMSSNNSSITPGGQFTVTVGVSGANNLYGMTAALSYDSSKLQLVASNGQSGFNATVGSKIVIDAAAPKSGTFSVITLTFKSTSAFAVGESTKISLSGIEGSDGAALLTGNGSSVSISMAAPKNSNNYLSSLTVTDGSIKFNKSTTSYSVTVDYNVSSVKIDATAEDATAKVSGTGTYQLNLYNNDIKVVVTAENGSKRTYNVTVIRKDKDGNVHELSGDVSLSGLTIEGHSFIFDNNIKEYTVLLKDTKLLNIVAVPTVASTTVEVVNPEQYATGNNVIKVKVTAENGTTDEYTINAVLAEKVEVKKTICVSKKCNVVLPIVISVLGTLVVVVVAAIVLAKVGYLKIKLPKKQVVEMTEEQKEE